MDQNQAPIIVWFRRDLRLSDNPALVAACASGRPVVALFIRDGLVDDLGAAPKWRLGLALEHLSAALMAKGSRLILRSGPAKQVLRAALSETGARAVYWSRLYDPASIARDNEIKTALQSEGIDARSFAGHLLFEPWTVQTGTGGYYRVFTPMWKTVRNRPVDALAAEPARMTAPENWPASEHLATWAFGAAMQRGAAVVRAHVAPGEAAALAQLDTFISDGIEGYTNTRDLPAVQGTSGLSDYLSLGEISPVRCWHAAQRALEEGKAGAETFRKELVWREFAYHLMYHTPRILTENWKPDWDRFPWRTDPDAPDVLAWKQGRTGMPFVDAAMRELYVTGKMHNRGRMIVASYLTKHLMTHWRIGQSWFEHCLIDWDPASNAMGWQWSAGSGPDSTPYFRVFNPETQLEKFDPDNVYVRRWIAEGQAHPPAEALSFFDAIPPHWKLSPQDAYPAPIVSARDGRLRALSAYENRGF